MCHVAAGDMAKETAHHVYLQHLQAKLLRSTSTHFDLQVITMQYVVPQVVVAEGAP